MAETTTHPQGRGDCAGGARTRRTRVENPATGRLTAPSWWPGPGRHSRAGTRSAFEDRDELFRRAQKWMVDNSERVISTIVSETGKAWEEAQLAKLAYVAGAFGFWRKNAGKFLGEQKVRSASPFVMGRKHAALRPKLAWWA